MLTISLISDNCCTNPVTFKLMGGPGKVAFQHEDYIYILFLVYDYVHIYN